MKDRTHKLVGKIKQPQMPKGHTAVKIPVVNANKVVKKVIK